MTNNVIISKYCIISTDHHYICVNVGLCFSNGSACPTPSVETELKLSAREPGAAREVDVTESVNMQKTTAEGDIPLGSSSVSEAVNQSGTAAAAAAMLPQSVTSVSPSTSTETKGTWICAICYLLLKTLLYTYMYDYLVLCREVLRLLITILFCGDLN